MCSCVRLCVHPVHNFVYTMRRINVSYYVLSTFLVISMILVADRNQHDSNGGSHPKGLAEAGKMKEKKLLFYILLSALNGKKVILPVPLLLPLPIPIIEKKKHYIQTQPIPVPVTYPKYEKYEKYEKYPPPAKYEKYEKPAKYYSQDYSKDSAYDDSSYDDKYSASNDNPQTSVSLSSDDGLKIKHGAGGDQSIRSKIKQMYKPLASASSLMEALSSVYSSQKQARQTDQNNDESNEAEY